MTSQNKRPLSSIDPSYFATRYAPDPNRSRVWKAICEYLQPQVAPDSVVLDVGAGYCDFINHIHAGRKYALDRNPELSEYCAPGVKFLCAEAGGPIDIPALSVDVIFASNFLEHLSDRECSDLFDRFDTLLKKSGKIILIQPNYPYCVREYWDDFTHVKAWSHVSLADYLVSRGYRILRMEKRFIPFSFKSVLPKSYWLTRLYLHSFWRPLAKQMLIVAER